MRLTRVGIVFEPVGVHKSVSALHSMWLALSAAARAVAILARFWPGGRQIVKGERDDGTAGRECL